MSASEDQINSSISSAKQPEIPRQIKLNMIRKARDLKREVKLSDETKVAGMKWAKLKFSVSTDIYHEQIWFKNLPKTEKKLLEKLIKAQKIQGNMDPLDYNKYANDKGSEGNESNEQNAAQRF